MRANPSTDGPIIDRGCFGIAEQDLPLLGEHRVAHWPVIATGRTAAGAKTLQRIRRHATWARLLRHATSVNELTVVDPPRWALHRIDRRRGRAGLEASTPR